MHIAHIALGGCLKAPPVNYGLTADTGGHIAYVLEAAVAQGASSGVTNVTIFTRLFDDHRLGPIYASEREEVAAQVSIHRIATGNRAYLDKEALGDDLVAFTVAFLDQLARMPVRPQVIHAHFADAAVVAMAARDVYAIPFVYTPHALGIDKQHEGGGIALRSRIAAERLAIETADAIIVSTRDEAERQVAAYGVPRARRRTYVMSPGVPRRRNEASNLVPPFADASKPLVLAIARPVRKKNLIAIVDAYAKTPLHDVSNLAILAGQWGRLSGGPEEREVIAALRSGLRCEHLAGRTFFPDRHSGADVRALYERAVLTGGVFVNPALHEPFGLTLLEAAAAGLPVVATKNGGAAEIVRTIGHGFVVDPTDHESIAAACLAIVTDRELHGALSSAAKRNSAAFSWPAYANASTRLYAALASNVTPRRHQVRSDLATDTMCKEAALV